ncbi:hypothetical protein SporoP37_11215 [Sporosarcina sp. P37]|uniref:FAD-dependent oxidoreductase n=1 Tax=unclassified Sporosarcina TaxID=2647733 RepID=UPI000A17B421|nr:MULTISPECIES: FAD-dependent oxidoreductase [unclassified Sporosarcina]ARK25168.1 hypothetical protein SporoP37_11215 [Sporosarcina sp. P37]PID17514.1 hypothetical protein CSV62_13280 [Sporosarcina sp. P35]
MKYEHVIIGAGITGMKVMLAAQKLGLKNVLLVDHNPKLGGFNSAIYQEKGFEKERSLISECNDTPYEIWTNSTVIGLFESSDDSSHEINIQTPDGTKDIKAAYIYICSGSLAKPREAHKIGGTRPAGVMTSNMAAGLLDRDILPRNQVAVYVNSKETLALAEVLAAKGVAVQQINADQHLIHMIYGKNHLEKIDIIHKENKELQTIECDSLIFSEGLIPATFYLRGTGIELNEDHFVKTGVDGTTNVKNILAFGTCTVQPDAQESEIEKSIKQILQ